MKIRNVILAGIFFSLFGISCIKEPAQIEEIKHGQLKTYTVRSTDPYIGIRGFNKVMVYLPPSYDPNTVYPVLYMLHGYGGTYRFWEDIESISQILDFMISTDQLLPLIVVFPNGFNDLAGSFYTNSIDSISPAFGLYETFIVNDVMGFIKDSFNIDTTRQAIAGISMGGYGALKLGAKYPEKFKVVIGFSGVYSFEAFLQKDPETGKSMVDLIIDENGDSLISPSRLDAEHPLTAMLFAMSAAFSPRVRDSLYFATHSNAFALSSYYLNPALLMGVALPFVQDPQNPANWQLDTVVWNQWLEQDVKTIVISNADRVKQAGTVFYFDCGKDDELKLFYHAQILDEVMSQLNINHTAEIFSSPTGYPDTDFPAGHTNFLYLRVKEGLKFLNEHL